MDQDQKGILVMDYLQDLGVSLITILDAICDENLEQSFAVIQENPKITKAEFLAKMNLEEEEY